MRYARVAVAVGTMGLLAGGCGDADSENDASTPAESDASPTVIVDNDGSFDDIKAILYLLERDDVEIAAITVSGTGVARCPQAAENTSALLARVDAPEIPVACGRQTPLGGSNEAPQAWRDFADAVADVALPEPRPLSELSAPDLIAATIADADGAVELVALGPLTNLAEAVNTDAEVLDTVEMMYLMGGAVDVPGNAPGGERHAEFNIWADPVAAQTVFATDVPITLVPLDATNFVPVTQFLYDTVAEHRGYSSASEFTAEYLDAAPRMSGMFHWDELAAVVASDESVVTIEERKVSISDAGVTVEDEDGRTTRVATAADAAAFEERFYTAIVGTYDAGG